MFESLSNRLSGVFDRLRRRGALSDADVEAALREIRVALLEADVALPVVKSFVDGVKAKAVGQDVIRSVTPAQMVVKIVHDHLVATLAGEDAAAGEAGLNLNAPAPVVVMMVGLQGSGKTTTTAKLARHLKERQRKKVMMASLDVQRPAAQEQLAVLGRQVSVDTLPFIAGERPVAIAKRAREAARLQGYDVLMLDTAGRLHIDEALMAEAAAVRDATHPTETLLVADALTGQDAVNVAKSFAERVGITGIVLTRVDGDARGGAALSINGVTGVPIKFVGTGEHVGAGNAPPDLEPFDAVRMAGRILGQGDVVALVERAAAVVDGEEAKRLERKVRSKKGMDLEDFLVALRQMQQMGPLKQVLGLLPGVPAKALQGLRGDERRVKHVEAIVLSMTPDERADPSVLNGSRRLRIAKGSGRPVQEVNRLLEQFQQMRKLLKRT